MAKNLTLAQKRQYLTLLIERDNGFKCFYCEQVLTQKTVVFEHLNGKRYDNRLDNLVLACQPCNIKKIKDKTMIDMADMKLEQNEEGIFVGEKFLKKNHLAGSTDMIEASKEIEINMNNFELTQQYITEIVQTDGYIEYKEALNSCVFLCKSRTGHGSQQSVRNYIATLTSGVGPFEIIRDENKRKLIVKRTDRIDLSRNIIPQLHTLRI